MAPDRHDLARRLSVVATEIAESAHEAATAGQAAANNADDFVRLAAILEQQAQDLGVIVGAIRLLSSEAPANSSRESGS